MKVLLLSPPQKEKMFPSLGNAYIVSVLNKNGHKAMLNDGVDTTVKKMVEFVGRVKPEAIGITMNTTNRFEGLELAKAIKIKYGLPIILGGPHPSLLPGQLLENYRFVDFIIRNEGEYSTLNLINALDKKEDLSKVRGISYRKEGKVVHNTNEPIIKNLDELPFPEWKFFDLKKYTRQVEYPERFKDSSIGSIISSRGCPYRCTFCSSSQVWGHNIRFRSAKNVLEEIKMLYNQGIRFFVYNDDNFTSNRKRAIEICKLMIEEGLEKEMGWQCRAEVNLMNNELLSWMKKANCNMIEFGVEDCTQEGIRWFKKGHTHEQVKNAFDLCKKYGIKAKSYFIVGETLKLRKIFKEKRNILKN